MFDFFDNQKNPLMFMMNMDNMKETDAAEEEATGADPMQLMTQAFMMQMQMMQTMCMMPLQLMQGFAKMMSASGVFDAFKPGDDAPAGQPGGFKLGNFEIPPQLLAKLMQLDMSPENLGKLQRVLDFVFEALPQQNKDESPQQEMSK